MPGIDFDTNQHRRGVRLKVPVVTLHGDVANEIIRYARENQITQIVIGHSDRTRWQEFVKGSIKIPI